MRVIVNRGQVLQPQQPLFVSGGIGGRDEQAEEIAAGPLLRTKSVRLTFTCAVGLKAELARYLARHA